MGRLALFEFAFFLNLTLLGAAPFSETSCLLAMLPIDGVASSSPVETSITNSRKA